MQDEPEPPRPEPPRPEPPRPEAPRPEAPRHDYAPTALPSTAARFGAFVAILLGGLCGGLIGYAIVDLQCTGDCTAPAGAAGLAGAITFALGVGVVAVLALRATAEWRSMGAPEETTGDRADGSST